MRNDAMAYCIIAKPPSSSGSWYLGYEVVPIDSITGVAPSADADGFLTGPRTFSTKEEAEGMVAQLTGRPRGYDTTHHTGV